MKYPKVIQTTKNDKDGDSRETLEDIREILLEILTWSRLQGMQQLGTVLRETFQRDAEKIIYQNSDGRDSRELAKISGVSHVTVINYWKKWAALGLVVPIRVRGGERYKRIFSPADFGIELPRNRPLSPGNENEEGKNE